MGHSISQRDVHTSRLRFSVLEVGQGPLVLCLHGFPDTPHGYRDVMLRLAADGYRAVAPFSRGIPPSQAPHDDDYSPPTLGQDALDLIGALGEERAIVIGHDWGAVTAYAAVALQPERVSKMVTVAIAPLKLTRPTPAWLAMVSLFQLGPLAHLALTAREGALTDVIYRAAAPTWRFGPEETADFKAMIAQPGGAQGALGTYRSVFRQFLRSGTKIPDFLRRKITVPSMVVIGPQDPTLVPGVIDRIAGEFEAPVEVVRLEGTGHFAHREQPEVFYRHLQAFLGPPRDAMIKES